MDNKKRRNFILCLIILGICLGGLSYLYIYQSQELFALISGASSLFLLSTGLFTWLFTRRLDNDLHIKNSIETNDYYSLTSRDVNISSTSTSDETPQLTADDFEETLSNDNQNFEHETIEFIQAIAKKTLLDELTLDSDFDDTNDADQMRKQSLLFTAGHQAVDLNHDASSSALRITLVRVDEFEETVNLLLHKLNAEERVTYNALYDYGINLIKENELFDKYIFEYEYDALPVVNLVKERNRNESFNLVKVLAGMNDFQLEPIGYISTRDLKQIHEVYDHITHIKAVVFEGNVKYWNQEMSTCKVGSLPATITLDIFYL